MCIAVVLRESEDEIIIWIVIFVGRVSPIFAVYATLTYACCVLSPFSSLTEWTEQMLFALHLKGGEPPLAGRRYKNQKAGMMKRIRYIILIFGAVVFHVDCIQLQPIFQHQTVDPDSSKWVRVAGGWVPVKIKLPKRGGG